MTLFSWSREDQQGPLSLAPWEQWPFDHSCSGREGAGQGAGLLGPAGKGRASAVVPWCSPAGAGWPCPSPPPRLSPFRCPPWMPRMRGATVSVLEVGIAKCVECGLLVFAHVISLKQGKPSKLTRKRFMANFNPGPDPREVPPPRSYHSLCYTSVFLASFSLYGT